MLSLQATIRKEFGRKTNSLRKQGVLPAVLYGPEIKNLSLEVDKKQFEKVFQEAGESSLLALEILDPSEGRTRVEGKDAKKVQVLIHDVVKDPVSGKILHVDFRHPSTRKEVTAEIPLVFEGETPAVRELGGTLIKEIQKVEVKGLAQNLPREIKVNIEVLKTFEDKIKIKDLNIPQGVTILKASEEIVANVAPPRAEEAAKEEKPVEAEKPAEKEKAGEEERGGEKKKEEKK